MQVTNPPFPLMMRAMRGKQEAVKERMCATFTK